MPTINKGFGPNDADTGLTASGTTSATAYLIGAHINQFTTVASSGTAKLPHVAAEVIVINQGANALVVYPPDGGKINALAANATVSIGVGMSVTFLCADPPMAGGTNWITVGTGGLASMGDNITNTSGVLSVNGITLTSPTATLTLSTAPVATGQGGNIQMTIATPTGDGKAGHLILTGIDTKDPAVKGAVYVGADNVLTISAGP